MDKTAWHKYGPLLWPRRSVDGGWIAFGSGQIWRRKFNGRWQYRQDEETAEQYDARQW